MLLLFLSALAVGFSGAVMPGPLLTYTIRQALNTGLRSGLIITAGHAILDLILIIFIFLGFQAVLQADAFQIIIGITGGLLLIYMGWGMVRDAWKGKLAIQADQNESRSRSMFVSGIVISAANPYFLLWWAVIGLGFVMQSFNTFGTFGIAIYYLGHISADFIWYSFISVVVGKTRSFIKDRPYRIVIAALGCLLIIFGLNFMYGSVTVITHL